jgi:hypothetical protein
MNASVAESAAQLRSECIGPVFVVGDDGIDGELAGSNMVIHHDPDVVVGAASEADVALAVRFARRHGLVITVHATGHGAHSSVSGGLVITTHRLDMLEVDAPSRTARVGAGVRWGAVVAAAAPFDLAPVSGASPTVGVVGLLLGGGQGPIGRTFGYGSDWLRSARVVTADGDVVTADERSHPELFWALRGGKVGLGIVTEVVIGLPQVPSLYAGSLFFEGEAIEPAFRFWLDWLDGVPDSVSSSAAFVSFPGIDAVPQVFRGKLVLTLRFASVGPRDEGERWAAPLRAAAPVLVDAIGPLPLDRVASIHNDPTDPAPGWTRGEFLGALDSAFADTLLATIAGANRPPFIAVELRHLGGRLARDVPEGSAVGGRRAEFGLVLVGVPDPSLFPRVLPAAADRLIDALSAWVQPEINVNYAGELTPRTLERCWPPAVLERLEAVRQQYDPQAVFRLP